MGGPVTIEDCIRWTLGKESEYGADPREKELLAELALVREKAEKHERMMADVQSGDLLLKAAPELWARWETERAGKD